MDEYRKRLQRLLKHYDAGVISSFDLRQALGGMVASFSEGELAWVIELIAGTNPPHELRQT